jgi:bifunctional DNA-binding transcriptional regulator/antitoxin component of YhaV-PrlF toxin-antitoxin module
MPRIKITAKRQATLPKALCRELGVRAGDTLDLVRETLHGESVWVVRSTKPDWSWFGAARRYARGQSHRWREVETSIARGWAGGDRP